MAFYWSMMTMTTVGYGDITPQTAHEYWFAAVAMLIGALATFDPSLLVARGWGRSLTRCPRKVRKMPSWPRSWANFSLL